jgi:hypothetical protein
MAKAPSSSSPDHDLAQEIERLMKHLPKADPRLLGTPGAMPAVRPSVARSALAGSTPTSRTPTARTPAARTPSDAAATPLAQQAHVWGRVALAAGFAAAVAEYQYSRNCGWMLGLYLAVVAVVMIAGAWGSIVSWRGRNLPAHVLSLVVVFWGIVLAAEQVLPRIGYAASDASWACRI